MIKIRNYSQIFFIVGYIGIVVYFSFLLIENLLIQIILTVSISSILFYFSAMEVNNVSFYNNYLCYKNLFKTLSIEYKNVHNVILRNGKEGCYLILYYYKKDHNEIQLNKIRMLSDSDKKILKVARFLNENGINVIDELI